MTKQLIGFGIAVMTTLLALVVLWQFRIVVVYVLISLMLAAALRPLSARRAEHRGARFGFSNWCYGASLLAFPGQRSAIPDQQLANSLSQHAWRLPACLEAVRSNERWSSGCHRW
jgi:hypothetical protein